MVPCQPPCPLLVATPPSGAYPSPLVPRASLAPCEFPLRSQPGPRLPERAEHRMTASILYLASLAGAVGLFFIMRPHRQAIRIGGTILAAGAVAFMMVEVLKALADDAPVPILEVIFGMGGIAGAVRMVTHPRPVFAAIWFVMVVVCSAGMHREQER